jgi:hypothetical protein
MEEARSNMTDDLVKRLRKRGIAELDEAADCIEKLEAGLRKIEALGFWDGDQAVDIACKVLGGKDG